MNILRPAPSLLTRWVASCLVLLSALLISNARAQFRYPPQLEGARPQVYREVDGTRLSLYLFEPSQDSQTRRPAIVFFFGGGWSAGSPAQFEHQCRELAACGMVAITADYRVKSRHNVKPTECLADAKAAIRWVRAHAEELGIDPARIAAAGGSAGGHLAAAAATVPGFDPGATDQAVSALPNALVLFNPALLLAPMGGMELKGFGTRLSPEVLGTEARNLSPAHHVKPGTAPAIIFHGRADTTVPYSTAEAFERTMKAAGNRCELVGFDGLGHGFFNYGRDGGAAYRATMDATRAFLASLGWIKPAQP